MTVRPLAIAYVCVMVVGLAISGQGHAQPSIGDPITLPDIPLINGKTQTAESFQGKAILVHYWATWCPFCLKQNANVQTLYEQSQETDIKILTVSTDDSAAEVTSYLEEHDYDFPVAMQSPELEALFGHPTTVPMLFTITEDGNIAEVIPGLMAKKDFMKLINLTNKDSQYDE